MSRSACTLLLCVTDVGHVTKRMHITALRNRRTTDDEDGRTDSLKGGRGGLTDPLVWRLTNLLQCGGVCRWDGKSSFITPPQPTKNPTSNIVHKERIHGGVNM